MSSFYRFIAKYFIAPPKKEEGIFTDNYDLVIVCGPQQLDQLRMCLISVLNNFKILPHVFIFTDPQVDMDACKKAVRWFPAGYLNIIRGSDCMSYHLQHKHNALLRFAKFNPMGLKIAAILQMLNAGKLFLYCDPETLWFNDPGQIVESLAVQNQFELAMTAVSQPHYDEDFNKQNDLEMINQPPYFSSGILLVKNISKSKYEALQALLAAAGEHTGPYIGESILAYINRESGNHVLDASQFGTNNLGRFSGDPVAKSYRGNGKTLFWRDALKIK